MSARARPRFVVDASVAAKWLIPETGSEAAARILEEDAELHVPELFDVELCHLLCKRVRRSELVAGEAHRLVNLVVKIPAERHGHRFLLPHTLTLALSASIAGYDAVYVALALALEATLVTADLQLAQRVRDAHVEVGVRTLH